MRPGGERPWSAGDPLYGAYYALVTQNKDEQNLHRVKVRFPWLPGGDVDQSYWALVATPMAGNEFGVHVLPEVGDLVVVMFLAGDISQPVVLGGIWSKTDTPPEDNSGGKNDFRGFKSRAGARFVLDDSTMGKVAFADKSDENGVVVGAFGSGGSGDNTRQASTPAACNGAKQDGVAVWSAKGKMSISVKGKLKVSAMNVELIADTTVDLKAGANASVKGAMGVVNGSSGVKLEGSSTKIN